MFFCRLRWSLWVGCLALGCTAGPLCSQELGLSATRPTVANSTSIQNPGVFQMEVGYDQYPQRVPGNQQTVDTLLTYAPLARLRLDFDWSAFDHQQSGAESANGVGTIAIGGKVEFKKEADHRSMPGMAIQYEASLPTASQQALQGYGQQAIFEVNHHYGPGGDLDVIVNGSIVQNCETQTGCHYGGQQSLAFSYHLTKQSRLYAEVFGQNVAASNTPPGTYVFTGFYRPFGQAFGIDGGLRFGVSDNSASIGTTVGVVFGKRLKAEPER